MIKILNITSAIGALVMAATPLLAIGGSARAAESSMLPVRILVGDLDLAQVQGAAAFDRRLDRAAMTFCLQNGVEMGRINACRQAVRDEAVAKLTTLQQQDLRAVAAGSALRYFARQ